MLDRALIRQNPDLVRQGARRKGLNAPVDQFLQVDAEWRAVKAELDDKNGEMNRTSKEIGSLMAQGMRDQAEEAKSRTAALKAEIRALEDRERQLESRLREIELAMPNLPHESVPDGMDATGNVVVRVWGEPPQLDREPQPHWEVADQLGLLDPARGAKIAGSGFVVYSGWGARLQRALFTFMADFQTDHNGYAEVYPPFLVNSESLIGTGNLPKFEEDLYKTDDGLYLIPTAEVPVTNLYRDEILEPWMLPIRLSAYTACFRREAGAAGKDTRGVLRMHQFDKVELVKFTTPESSYDELESLVLDAESVLQALGVHYRVTLLCAGDMGDKGSKCYDLELWSPGTGQWLEISSCTNFEAYQARRAGIRFRRGPGEKPEYVHTLNGSGVATPRLFAVILESFYRADGCLDVPPPLRAYMGVDCIPAPE
jgi:seryl-tRNA synthetase